MINTEDILVLLKKRVAKQKALKNKKIEKVSV